MNEHALQEVVVSGMRPTGRLHIGHYFGVLKNWLTLQEKQKCYFFAADWHCLTTDYANVQIIHESLKDVVTNWLAAGVDPQKAVLFVQSHVPQHAELHLLLSMITPVSWLERVPSYKELKNELKEKDLSTYGFLGYPLLQTADVALYKATAVPVGQDQDAHIELSREVLRRFNFLYGDFFPEPKTLLTQFPKVPGTDGRKMSKSYDNCIYLGDEVEVSNQKIMKCITDPHRIRRQDTGNPDVCTIFDYHKLVTSEETRSQIASDCRSASIGCVDCKKILIKNLNHELEPFREKRQSISASTVTEVLVDGAKKATQVASANMTAINAKMKVGVFS